MAAKKTTATGRRKRRSKNLYGTGDKGKATRLHSLIIRSIGYCEICGSTENLQCAHIISRQYDATRTDLRNAICACAGCHLKQSHFSPIDISLVWLDKYGKRTYNQLKKIALEKELVDWSKELARLIEIADGMGVKHGYGTSNRRAG